MPRAGRRGKRLFTPQDRDCETTPDLTCYCHESLVSIVFFLTCIFVFIHNSPPRPYTVLVRVHIPPNCIKAPSRMNMVRLRDCPFNRKVKIDRLVMAARPGASGESAPGSKGFHVVEYSRAGSTYFKKVKRFLTQYLCLVRYFTFNKRFLTRHYSAPMMG